MGMSDGFYNPDAGDFYTAPTHSGDTDTIQRLADRGPESNSGAIARRLQFLEGAVEALTSEIRALKESM